MATPVRASSFLVAGAGTDAHDARRHAGGGAGDDAGERRQAMRLHRRLGGDDQRGRAVIDAGGVAGGHRAALAEGCRQLGERLQGGGARVLVSVDDDRIALALGDRDRDDLAGKAAVLLAAAARVWLRRAKASWSARLTW